MKTLCFHVRIPVLHIAYHLRSPLSCLFVCESSVAISVLHLLIAKPDLQRHICKDTSAKTYLQRHVCDDRSAEASNRAMLPSRKHNRTVSVVITQAIPAGPPDPPTAGVTSALSQAGKIMVLCGSQPRQLLTSARPSTLPPLQSTTGAQCTEPKVENLKSNLLKLQPWREVADLGLLLHRSAVPIDKRDLEPHDEPLLAVHAVVDVQLLYNGTACRTARGERRTARGLQSQPHVLRHCSLRENGIGLEEVGCCVEGLRWRGRQGRRLGGGKAGGWGEWLAKTRRSLNPKTSTHPVTKTPAAHRLQIEPLDR